MQGNASELLNDKKSKFFINDHIDILIEILQRLDGASLGVAACVCRLWCAMARNDLLWEHVCFSSYTSTHSLTPVRPVVVALGGYKRLYMVCGPVLSRLGESKLVRRAWTQNEVQLSLSLFCVDYYERVGDASPLSLTFLCK